MLEQFKVKEADAVMVQEAPLRETVASVFRKMGVSDSDSVLATDVLVKADMRGVETHGVSNVLRSYVTGYGSGEINPSPNWHVVRETQRHRQHRFGPGSRHHRGAKSHGDRHREGAERRRWDGHDP